MRNKEIDEHLDKLDKEIEILMKDISELSNKEVLDRINYISYSYHTVGSLFKEL